MNQLLRTLSPILVACLVVLAGCDEPGDTVSDASTGGAADGGGGNSPPESAVVDAGGSQPLFGTPELSGCLPTVCDSEGMTWEEAYGELKTFWQTHPACTEIPPDLLCRMKSADHGDDWAETMEARIQSAAAKSGGFLDEQFEALRCLGFMEPSQEFLVSAGAPDARLPSKVQVDLEMPGPAAGVSLRDEFFEQFGPLVGTLLQLTDDYQFEETIKAPGDDHEIRLSALSYKGIAVEPGYPLRVDIELGKVTWPTGGSAPVVCLGKWVFVELSTNLSRHIETLETDLAKLVPAEQALTAALTECGDDCSHPVTDWEVDSGPSLFITAENVVWRVTVNCPVPECNDELWMCTYRIDAETGSVLSGGLECCIDCPGLSY